MLGLNNLASSKIMIGLLNRLSRAHGKAQMWRQLKKKWFVSMMIEFKIKRIKTKCS